MKNLSVPVCCQNALSKTLPSLLFVLLVAKEQHQEDAHSQRDQEHHGSNWQRHTQRDRQRVRTRTAGHSQNLFLAIGAFPFAGAHALPIRTHAMVTAQLALVDARPGCPHVAALAREIVQELKQIARRCHCTGRRTGDGGRPIGGRRVIGGARRASPVDPVSQCFGLAAIFHVLWVNVEIGTHEQRPRVAASRYFFNNVSCVNIWKMA